MTSKVRAACGEGGKDLENISSAVLKVFSAKKNHKKHRFFLSLILGPDCFSAVLCSSNT